MLCKGYAGPHQMSRQATAPGVPRGPDSSRFVCDLTGLPDSMRFSIQLMKTVCIKPSCACRGWPLLTVHALLKDGIGAGCEFSIYLSLRTPVTKTSHKPAQPPSTTSGCFSHVHCMIVHTQTGGGSTNDWLTVCLSTCPSRGDLH